MIENYEADQKLKQIRAVFDSRYDGNNSEQEFNSAAIAYLNEVRVDPQQSLNGNKLFTTSTDLRNQKRRKNNIQEKAQNDVDLSKPHIPEHAYRSGMLLDDLMFEAHKKLYKDKLRAKIMTEREATKQVIQELYEKKQQQFGLTNNEREFSNEKKIDAALNIRQINNEQYYYSNMQVMETTLNDLNNTQSEFLRNGNYKVNNQIDSSKSLVSHDDAPYQQLSHFQSQHKSQTSSVQKL
eukprot:403348292